MFGKISKLGPGRYMVDYFDYVLLSWAEQRDLIAADITEILKYSGNVTVELIPADSVSEIYYVNIPDIDSFQKIENDGYIDELRFRLDDENETWFNIAHGDAL